jgi:UDP-N-acetylglucosamine diphosphorylase/glucosamine-1-phosphate N-acetyltransferase
MAIPVYVFEDSQVDRLFPLTYARAACELRIGALTLLERLQKNLGAPVSGLLVRSGLAEVLRQRITNIPINPALSTRGGILLVNARWLLLEAAENFHPPDPDSAGLSQSTVVWMHLTPDNAQQIDLSRLHEPRAFDRVLAQVQRLSSSATLIDHPWDLLDHQRAAILEDFTGRGRAMEATVFPGAHLLDAQNIHLGPGVKIWPGVVLDAQHGPIIIERDTEVRANAVITGPVAIGQHCLIRTGSDIREESTLGPNTRVGGEVIGSIFLGNANKQHHGFLGQSIVGEWANLGAGTTTSNLKNTYGIVRMPLNGKSESTGRLFLGSVIADHVKLGIGTYLSTGSVIGFASHVVVPRPPQFVPSFAWLTEKGLHRADFEKLEQIAATVMQRRGATFTSADHDLFVRIASEWSLAEEHQWSA